MSGGSTGSQDPEEEGCRLGSGCVWEGPVSTWEQKELLFPPPPALQGVPLPWLLSQLRPPKLILVCRKVRIRICAWFVFLQVGRKNKMRETHDTHTQGAQRAWKSQEEKTVNFVLLRAIPSPVRNHTHTHTHTHTHPHPRLAQEIRSHLLSFPPLQAHCPLRKHLHW